MCGIAAVHGANCVWECSCKGNKFVRKCCCTGSKLFVGLLLYREQIRCWDCWCTGSKLVVVVLLYREQLGCEFAALE